MKNIYILYLLALIPCGLLSQNLLWQDNSSFNYSVNDSRLESDSSGTNESYIFSENYVPINENGHLEITDFKLDGSSVNSNSVINSFTLYFTYEQSFSLANVHTNGYGITYDGVNNTLSFHSSIGTTETLNNITLSTSDVIRIEKVENNRLLLKYNNTEHLIADNFIEDGHLAVRTNTNNLSFAISNSGFSQRAAATDIPIGDTDKNWIFARTWDNEGAKTSSGISYFDCLARPTQTQSKDFKTNKTWVNETMYDSQGRPAIQTLSAPIGQTTAFNYKEGFTLASNGNPFDIDDYETTNLERPNTVDNNVNTLGWYYSNSNTSERYQDITNRPYSRTIYDELNPGAVRKVVGGKIMDLNGNGNTNDAVDGFPQGFSYTVPAAQEMQYVFGKNYFPSESINGMQKILTKFYKNVSIDVDGTETVSFTDGEGKLLAAARSGGTQQYEVVSIIGEQKYIDVHIPSGASGPVFFGNPTGVVVYNLRTGESLSNPNLMTNGNIYRIQGNSGLNKESIYIQNDGIINADLAVGIRYNVNYYDYSLNYYDQAGRLKRSTQPTGFDESCIAGGIQATTSHGMKSYYNYNASGELTSTSSPDEGSAIFKYREDGQIRYSRNSKQLDALEFSYTNYDPLGRPIESGAYWGGSETYESLGIVTGGITKGSSIQENGSTLTKIGFNSWSDSGFGSTEKTGAGNFSISFNITGEAEGVVGVSVTDDGDSYSTVDYGLYFNKNQASIISNGEIIGKSKTYYNGNETFFIERSKGMLLFKKGSKEIIYSLETWGEQTAYPEMLVDGALYSVGAEVSNIEIENQSNTKIAATPSVPLPLIDEVLDPTFCKEQVFTDYDTPDTEGLHNVLYSGGGSGLEQDFRVQRFLSGNVSKTYTKHPETNTTWYSYDVYGRVAWMVQFTNGLGAKTIDYTYDDATGAVNRVTYQGDDSNDRFIHKYMYNDVGQLEVIKTSRDGSNFIEHANYIYYETGALKRVNLAEGLQGIDYVYTLSGQLKAMNHSSLTTTDDPGNDQNDAFGLIIDYYKDDYSRANTGINSTSSGLDRYDGNIKATRWGTEELGQNNGYVYEYNENKWLTTATFGSFSNNNFTPNSTSDFKVFDLDYDQNGNISHLDRNKSSINGSNAMDRLRYNYKPNKNQLDYVEDNSGNFLETDGDIKAQQPNNYVYNSIGQLIENKQDNLFYNYYTNGLVSSVTGPVLPNPIIPTITKGVYFEYNDRGHRVSKKVYDGENWVSETYYTRDASGQVMATYYTPLNSGGSPKTNFPIYGLSRLGMADTQNIFKYQLTDHLGNVRAVIQRDGNIDGIIVDADFESNLPSWPASSNVSHDGSGSGYLGVTSIDGDATTLRVPFSVEANHTYAVSFDVDLDGTPNILEYSIEHNSPFDIAPNTTDENGEYNFTFTSSIIDNVFLKFYLRNNSPTVDDGDNNYKLGFVKITDVTTANAPIMLAKRDYYPFGMPMPSRYDEGDYPYAYQGQEKDTETGMEAFELRLWDARIGRWLTTDPAGQYSSPYLGMGNNPVNGIDPDGGWFDRWELDLSTGETNWVNNDGGDTTDYLDVVAGGGDDTVLLSQSYDVQHVNQTINHPTWEVNGGSNFTSIPGFRITTEHLAGGSGALTDPSAGLFVDYAVGLGVGKLLTWGGRLLRAPAPIIKNKASGLAMEEALGMGSPKTAIRVDGRLRYPDRLTSTLIEESKNVKQLYYTRQLKDYVIFAKQNELQMILHTRSSTILSKPLQNIIDEGVIIHSKVPGF